MDASRVDARQHRMDAAGDQRVAVGIGEGALDDLHA